MPKRTGLTMLEEKYCVKDGEDRHRRQGHDDNSQVGRLQRCSLPAAARHQHHGVVCQHRRGYPDHNTAHHGCGDYSGILQVVEAVCMLAAQCHDGEQCNRAGSNHLPFPRYMLPFGHDPRLHAANATTDLTSRSVQGAFVCTNKQ